MYQTGLDAFVERLEALAVREGGGPPSDINTVAMALKVTHPSPYKKHTVCTRYTSMQSQC